MKTCRHNRAWVQCPICEAEDFDRRYSGLIGGAVAFAALSFLLFFLTASCRGAEASFYDHCYDGKLMASGKPFNASKPIAASWFYTFGTRLLVTNLENGKSTIVTCLDRGPAKWLVRQGRIIDLSESAFAKIADTNLGLIRVRIKKL